jgi:hypothetical protein
MKYNSTAESLREVKLNIEIAQDILKMVIVCDKSCSSNFIVQLRTLNDTLQIARRQISKLDN